jgi:hypothetical protein
MYLVNPDFDEGWDLDSYGEFLFTKTTDPLPAVRPYYTCDNDYRDSGNLRLPFDIKLTFNWSDTVWLLEDTKYLIDDTKVGGGGSFEGSQAGKVSIEIDNTTDETPLDVDDIDYDYLLILDMGSTGANFNITYSVGSEESYPPDLIDYSGTMTWPYTLLNYVYIPGDSIITITTEATSANRYLDSFYIIELGKNAGWVDGVETGVDGGFSQGYLLGNSNGYSSGYLLGESVGYSDGLLDNSGYILGFEDGSNESFLGSFDTWIVPAIIVVLFLGGGISIWAIKKRENQ